MTWTDLANRIQTRFPPVFTPRSLRIRTKLLVVLIPSVVAILMVTGYVTYLFSQQFLQTALERVGIVQTLALARSLEDVLAMARRDLLFFASQPPAPTAMAAYLERINTLRAVPYREFGYLDLESREHVLFITVRDHVTRVPTKNIEDIRPTPFKFLEQGRDMAPGQALLGDIVHLDYHLTMGTGTELIESTEVFRLATPRIDDSGKVLGIYLLSVGARDLRNVLSLYNSNKSPIHGYERSPEVRYSFLFDTEGWALFQSEDPDKPQLELTTYLVRAGYSGTLGRRGMESAFRPEAHYKNYWKMVDEVRQDRSGIINQADIAQKGEGEFKMFFMPYAPVRFQTSEDGPPKVVAGVANMDKSQMTLRAGYKQVDVVFIITLAAILLVTGILILLARAITRPIIELSRSVTRVETSGELAPLRSRDRDHETTLLKNAINGMIEAIRRQMVEIQDRDQKIEQVHMREQASFNPAVQGRLESLFPEIKGAGPLMERLRTDVAKAAQVGADVLITGETGTGKQLVAEAIHRHSRRATRPFISINCGALDENLLLDTLFGHVKGAFTEARTDRNGAFLEAEGGLLFLDEIQTATPKVQQALLRAIAMRRIRPLGSDKEIAVDTRIIAATNVDLRDAIARGIFREDLYFRLKVISVDTPPLRLHKESISLLVHHFLKQAGSAVDKPGLGLSRGALAKLNAYDWPGNIRELKHCILRTAIMTEHAIIQDADIVLDREPGPWPTPIEVPAEPKETFTPPPAEPPALNARQTRALPAIVRQGSITRGGYQDLLDGLPQRTAVHDLKDLVEKGYLVKRGSGPATRYETTEAAIALAVDLATKT